MDQSSKHETKSSRSILEVNPVRVFQVDGELHYCNPNISDYTNQSVHNRADSKVQRYIFGYNALEEASTAAAQLNP